jgi:hypothetical protein
MVIMKMSEEGLTIEEISERRSEYRERLARIIREMFEDGLFPETLPCWRFTGSFGEDHHWPFALMIDTQPTSVECLTQPGSLIITNTGKDTKTPNI